MKKEIILGIAVISIACWFITGCNDRTETGIKTKADSLAFAQKIVEKYSNEVFSKSGDVNFSKKKWDPLDWNDVVSAADAYDLNPYVIIGRNVINGFIIDEDGLSALRGLNSSKKKVYIRFGYNTSNEKTLMVLPLDASNNVDKSNGVNFDHLDPCPPSANCPGNFQ